MVRDPSEGHHGVERDEDSGEQVVQRGVQVLAHHKHSTVDVRAHLQVVVHGQVPDSIGVHPPRPGVLGRRDDQVVGMRLQELVEDEAVLQAGVQPLPEEGYNSVGRVPQDEGAPGHEVRAAAERDHGAGRVGKVVLHETVDAYEVHGVWKVLHEEGQEVFLGLDGAEDVEGHEEGQGEGPVLVGQGNHHELVPGPDVEVVLRHGEVARGRWRHAQLLVAVVDVLLLVVEPPPPHHLPPHRRKGAVATQDEVGTHQGFLGLLPHVEVEGLLVQVSPVEAILEVEGRHLFRLRQQQFVEPAPIGGVDGLSFRPVGLGRELPVQ